LVDVLGGFGEVVPLQAKGRAARSRWNLLHHCWLGLGEGVHALAFRSWVGAIGLAVLEDRQAANWLRATASLIAKRASQYDTRRANASWNSWITEGPSNSIGRLHRLSRVATGWVPSMVGIPEDRDEAVSLGTTNWPNNEDECDGGPHELSEEQVERAESIPLSGQTEVDRLGKEWGVEWDVDGISPALPWPADIRQADAPLASMTVEIVRAAARTFPIGTGLGWDKLHPRAVARCSDEALMALVRIFVLAELLGQWPQLVGLVLVCLIPKPGGGRRPIGLLPSMVRLWMRIRLDVARSWQTAYDRPFFYAGPKKGAKVASWKQAARAELAATGNFMEWACGLLDLVKAFERVPHDWLVRQAVKFHYPLLILRLSLAAYRLGRVVVVGGISTEIMWACRGIVAGAVHATIELRVILFQWAEETTRLHHLITLKLYVDDASLEAAGPSRMVKREVIGAITHFVKCVEAMGMEFSPTKNCCIASCQDLAEGIARELPGLRMTVAKRVKSLGGALGGGKVRNVCVLKARLLQFKVRKERFRKLRRAVGAKRTGAVLRSGGTSALVYGQANTGVASSMLLNQRRAVAASYVAHGAGDLDLTLTLADGTKNGRADPAFAAHDDPIGMWSDAVWSQWLPRTALDSLTKAALAIVNEGAISWSKVRGPAAAFVASALRLGWQVNDAFNLVTDRGWSIDLCRDSPAFVISEVRKAVWRWRWRRLEGKHPCLAVGAGGYGPLVLPIFGLLNSKPRADWGAKEQGGLRSTVADRQWPQARLKSAGLVTSPNCQLCVRFGHCAMDDTSLRHRGTLLHRLWTCPVLEQARCRLVPEWLREEVRQALRADGTMAPEDLLLYTRALTPSPEASVAPAPQAETFEWVIRPTDGGGATGGKFYVDGSMLDAEWQLAGCCARRGWAFAVVDEHGEVIASARGRPPAWTGGINGAELWSLLMAALAALPGSTFRIDCMAVQLGTQLGEAWAAASERQLARAWGPLAAALEGHVEDVVWMPAHCTREAVATRRLGDGSKMTEVDRRVNEVVDGLAKSAARADRVPLAQRLRVHALWDRVTAIAIWIGQATVIAGEFPDPDAPPGGGKNHVRDSEGRHTWLSKPRAGTKRKREADAADRPLPASDVQAAVGAVSVKRTRHTPGSVRSVTPSVAVLYQRRAAASRREAVRTRLAEQAQVARWLAANTLVPSAQPPAADRFAALRARARARQAAAEAGPVAPLAGAEGGAVSPPANAK
jgi:hypothetical protein